MMRLLETKFVHGDSEKSLRHLQNESTSRRRDATGVATMETARALIEEIFGQDCPRCEAVAAICDEDELPCGCPLCGCDYLPQLELNNNVVQLPTRERAQWPGGIDDLKV